jgi:NAD(P)-dependent dehydrogenase (short-subunit alcohol dehydrogenase family)
MLVTPLLEPHVVVGADAGEHRDLLATEAGHAPAAGQLREPNIRGLQELAPRAQVLADQVLARQVADNDTRGWRFDPGPVATRINGSLVRGGPAVNTGLMTSTTRIQTRFGFDTTAAEVIEGIDLSGRHAIVTGASSGIGVDTAQALASAGAAVTLAVRNTDAGERAATQITNATAHGRVDVRPLDLADPASVTAFAGAWTGPLHILVNNAGVMALPELELTPDGWELQFATNHLGHFALALGLHDALAAAGNARIVSLSSRGHLRSPVVFDDINFSSRPYDPWLAYGQSKTANVLFAVGATNHWAADGIIANAVHPGGIMETNLARHMDQEQVKQLRAAAATTGATTQTINGAPIRFKTIAQGAATSVLVATSPELEGIGGRYFEDCNEAEQLTAGNAGTAASGVAPYALDPEAAERLWALSLTAVRT